MVVVDKEAATTIKEAVTIINKEETIVAAIKITVIKSVFKPIEARVDITTIEIKVETFHKGEEVESKVAGPKKEIKEATITEIREVTIIKDATARAVMTVKDAIVMVDTTIGDKEVMIIGDEMVNNVGVQIIIEVDGVKIF